MVILVFAMVCGVYIYSICLKQLSVHTRAECEHNPVQFFAILSMQRSQVGGLRPIK